VRTKKRSDAHGEVFTPPWLVNQMLDELDDSSFNAPGKTFIDPACGNGNILVEIIRRKIKNGCTAYQALMTTYGVDIMPDNIDECRERLIDAAYEATSTTREGWQTRLFERAVNQTIRLGDTLKFELDDIFSKKPSKELKAFREKSLESTPS
jgi:SAM-dependent methyltransferase